MRLSEMLRRVRAERRQSLRVAAYAMGTSASTLNRIEAGITRAPSAATIGRIAKYIRVEPFRIYLAVEEREVRIA